MVLLVFKTAHQGQSAVYRAFLSTDPDDETILQASNRIRNPTIDGQLGEGTNRQTDLIEIFLHTTVHCVYC